ncbi:MAG: sulfatase [Anaerolineae bacterium]
MKTKKHPDILLIVLDTLRADRLSSYGYHRNTTPHLDAFAEEGVLYERAISPGQWTIPSHASLFTGEYPTTHMTTQIYDKHSEAQPTLAEMLKVHGYDTVGFCNNPLLGVVANDLDRGFDAFYNYGGTFPERPSIGDSRPRRTGKLAQRMVRLLRHMTQPVQDLFARSDFLLRLALHPRLVPLWRRYINFKGNSVQSVRDLVGYLQTRQRKGAERPLFAFVNLMETHLPFGPPRRFIRKFVPYYGHNREARAFMRGYNHEHYRWMVPLQEPLTELQDRVINDMYDAEVAYTDAMLRQLFAYLRQPEVRDNTMVIITSDHGEGMNNHDFVGHSLVAYDDLVRVPLVVRYPRLYPEGVRVSTPVSTRRVFHSALEATALDPEAAFGDAPVDVAGLSLARSVNGEPDPEGGVVFAEAFTPHTLLTLMENDDPEAIEYYRCRSMRRAVYREQYKLIEVGDAPDELFDVVRDPGELVNLMDREPEVAEDLDAILRGFVTEAESRRPAELASAQVSLEGDLEERLRGLGYLG